MVNFRTDKSYECLECSKEFYVTTKDKKRTNPKFCSRDCFNKNKTREGNIFVNCAHCNAELVKKKSHARHNSKTGMFFCNAKCQQAEQRIGGKIAPAHFGTSKHPIDWKHDHWGKKNLSKEEIDYEIEKQDNKCKICGKKDRLVVDHCHKENKFRGMLCNNCNRGLGFFKDSPEIMSNAINYIEDFKSTIGV